MHFVQLSIFKIYTSLEMGLFYLTNKTQYSNIMQNDPFNKHTYHIGVEGSGNCALIGRNHGAQIPFFI